LDYPFLSSVPFSYFLLLSPTQIQAKELASLRWYRLAAALCYFVIVVHVYWLQILFDESLMLGKAGIASPLPPMAAFFLISKNLGANSW
jgi:hypothetical protein